MHGNRAVIFVPLLGDDFVAAVGPAVLALVLTRVRFFDLQSLSQLDLTIFSKHHVLLLAFLVAVPVLSRG